MNSGKFGGTEADLDIAKRGVEMAIEKSEKDAENWIEAELNKSSASVA